MVQGSYGADPTHEPAARADIAKRRFWRTLAGVLAVQMVALALLWLLQTTYGL